MTTRGTLLLLVILAALVVTIVLDSRSAGPLLPVHTPALLPRDPAQVSRLEIESAAARATFVRGPGGWTGSTDRAAMAPDLLATLATLRPILVVDPSPADATVYGLGGSGEHVRAIQEDGTTVVDLEVGAFNPPRTGLYVQQAGRPEVVLVGALLRWEIDKLRPAPVGSGAASDR